MPISCLKVNNLRNITQAILEPAATFNVIYGENGSGKTSLLEAIYLLGVGRSFRSRNIEHVIQANSERTTVFGLLQEPNQSPLPLGIERDKSGAVTIRINEYNVKSIAELAHYLPIQLLNQDSYQLLTGSPKFRRQFVDWGLFHVEQSFFTLWKRFYRSLQQRNAALKNRVADIEIKLWDKEFIESANLLDSVRKKYMALYIPLFEQVLQQISIQHSIELTYRQGWRQDNSLADALKESYLRDKQFGFTHNGPHRADIDIKINKIAVSQVLSRGQQKILAYGLQLAQGLLLTESVNRHCLYLIDDMPAELDEKHMNKVLRFLEKSQAQLFLTCITPSQFKPYLDNKGKLFHVKHGEIVSSD